jgi:hypothetical protein
MSIAGQADPEKAAIEFRKRAVANQQAYRKRQREPVRIPSQHAIVEREAEPTDDPDQVQQWDSEPDEEPQPPSHRAADPLKTPLDALEEAVACKNRILALVPLMTTVGGEQFLITLVEDVKAVLNNMEREQ